jgi:hypothetical protein
VSGVERASTTETGPTSGLHRRSSGGPGNNIERGEGGVMQKLFGNRAVLLLFGDSQQGSGAKGRRERENGDRRGMDCRGGQAGVAETS